MTLNCMCGVWNKEGKAESEKMIAFAKKHAKIQWQGGGIPPIGHKNRYNHARYWEYGMAVGNTNPQPGDKILDVGGTNSLLSWYLALQGINVTTVDPVGQHMKDAQNNNKHFKLDNIKFVNARMENADLQETYDHIYSVCVIEHILQESRKGHWDNFWKGYELPKELVQLENKFVQSMSSRLNPGGKLVITYSYIKQKGNAGGGSYNQCAYYRSTQDVIDRIIMPSNLKLTSGNIDNALMKGELPIGIVFLRSD